MAKVSRPILYTALAGAVVYAVVLFTEPDTPPHKPKARPVKSSTAVLSGFTAEDQRAHFARYTRGLRDAFLPKVVSNRKSAGIAPAGVAILSGGAGGGWTLTGINVINGVRTALIENGATRDILFLKAGDIWKGLRVTAIDEDAVVFVDALKRQTRLAFVEPGPAAAPEERPNNILPGLGAPSPGTLVAVPSSSVLTTTTPRTNRGRNANRP